MFTCGSLEAAKDPGRGVHGPNREAGKENQLLRDLNIVAQADDQRRIEVVANGLPFWGGKQVAIDTTVVSALTGRGVARGRREGQAIHEGGTGQAPEMPRVAHRDQVPLFVMAFEVAGRWSPSAVTFLRNLAWCKSLRAQSPSPFNPAPVLPAFPSSGLTLPACWGGLWESARDLAFVRRTFGVSGTD